MNHLALLGDSIFDNAPYVADKSDVTSLLRAILPSDWRASLLAVDGSVTRTVPEQLGRLPKDATHILVSVGGNDALHSFSVVQEQTTSVEAAMARLWEVRAAFERDYRTMLEIVLERQRPVAVCTIYEPPFLEARQRRIADVGLCLFNDVITREAFRHDLPVIDLRLIATETSDFSNTIEPSEQGEAKIACAIAMLVNIGFDLGHSRIVW